MKISKHASGEPQKSRNCQRILFSDAVRQQLIELLTTDGLAAGKA